MELERIRIEFLIDASKDNSDRIVSAVRNFITSRGFTPGNVKETFCGGMDMGEAVSSWGVFPDEEDEDEDDTDSGR